MSSGMQGNASENSNATVLCEVHLGMHVTCVHFTAKRMLENYRVVHLAILLSEFKPVTRDYPSK